MAEEDAWHYRRGSKDSDPEPIGAGKLFSAPAPLADLEETLSTALAIEKDPEASPSTTPSDAFDLPRAPELPASLDIDLQASKYPVTCPGPGHDDDHEVQASLLHREESVEHEMEGYDLPLAAEGIPRPLPAAEPIRRPQDQDYAALRRQYEAAAVLRPRPTTPTSWNALESYVQKVEDVPPPVDRSVPPDAGAKMRVVIPGKESLPPVTRRRKSSMSWSDFYESMAAQIPAQVAGATTARTMSGRSTPQTVPVDGDILDENPFYKEKVPPAPVVHRRTSIEWEVFDDGIREIDPRIKMDQQPTASVPASSETSNEAQSTQPSAATVLETYNSSIHDYQPAQPPSHDSYSAADDSSYYQPGATETYQPAQEVPSTYDDNSYYDQGINNDSSQFYSTSTAAVEDQSQYSGYQQEDSTYQNYQDTDASHSATQDSQYAQDSYHYPDSTTDHSQTGATYDWQQSETDKPASKYDSYQYPPTASQSEVENQTVPVAEPYQEQQQAPQPAPSYVPALLQDINQYKPHDPYSWDAQDSYTEQYQAPGSQTTATYDTQSYYPETQAGYQEDTAHSTYDNQSDYAATQDTTGHSQYYNAGTTDSYTSGTGYGTAAQSFTQSYGGGISNDPYSWENTEQQYTQPTAYTQSYDQAAPEAQAPSAHDEPAPPQAAVTQQQKSVEKEASVEEEDEKNDAWKMFQRMSDNVGKVVKQTEAKLKTLEENTLIRAMPNRQYEMKPPTPPPPENLMDITDEMLAKKKMAEKDGKEWKPISERLNDEIKKQKELNKPSRPPPPKGVPPPRRPPPPGAAAASSAWDDDGSAAIAPSYAPPSRPPPAHPAPSLSEWDDHSQNAYSAATGQYQPSQSVSTYDNYPTPQQIEPTRAPEPQKKVEEDKVETSHWAGFEDSSAPELPPSESGFFSKLSDGYSGMNQSDAFAAPVAVDPFAPLDENLLMQQSYDPFEVRSVEELVAEAKAKAEAETMASEAANDLDFFGLGVKRHENGGSGQSSPTPEGGSPASSRPPGFEDEFRPRGEDEDETPSPLYDEDDSEELEPYPPKFTGDGWELMLRHPLKKKIMGDRYWKPCFMRLHNNTILLFNSKAEQRPFQELPLQSSYSLSDITLQQYDIYGKIITVKLQYVLYKERVGIRPGQITRLVEGHFTKYGLPLEHAAQSTPLLKLGSLKADELASFVNCVEDVLFHCPARREGAVIYKQDEIQVHCYDEYSGYVDKMGVLSQQKARVRLFCLAFVSGMPYVEIGLNDRRRQGKEIVRRKDILPMYTERWIRFENLEFHSTVDRGVFDKEHVIKFLPPDGCFFEIMRFRVRPPRNREVPLHVKCIMKMAGSKVEIRLEAMVAGFASKKARQVPCEDIQIRFPIPEAWIYLFREERHWGYGSVHAKVRRPGKVKNLKDRLMGAVQHIDNCLIEVAIGEAKYEHVHRALVWRIARLPEKHHGAYKNHLLKCRFELSSFDLMPETFLPTCDVEFTMPLATVSNTVVRSVSLEQHEDPDRVEKFVRYVARCQYKIEVDYVQCTDLDVDAILDTTNANPEKGMETIPDLHKPAMDSNAIKDSHDGYRIDFTESEMGGGRFERHDSSSDEEDGRKGKMPIIQIDMKGYGY